MRERALAFLVCPRCRGSLVLTNTAVEGDQITTGQLACAPCAVVFPIAGGVPRFAAGALAEGARRTVDRFGEQWNEFNFLSAEYQTVFAWIAPNTWEAFHDRVVLAGCDRQVKESGAAETPGERAAMSPMAPDSSAPSGRPRRLPWGRW